MKNNFAYFALVILSSSLAWAASKDPFAVEHQAYFGALGGVSVPDAQYTTSRSAFGFTAGAKLSDEYGLGFFYLNSRKDEVGQNPGVSFGFEYGIYGVEANYYFDGSAAGAHFGARVGTAKVTKGEVTGRDYSSSPFVYGLQGGYDHMLGNHFSLGGEFNAMFVQGGPQDSVTGTVVGPFATLNFLLAAKFWL